VIEDVMDVMKSLKILWELNTPVIEYSLLTKTLADQPSQADQLSASQIHTDPSPVPCAAAGGRRREATPRVASRSLHNRSRGGGRGSFAAFPHLVWSPPPPLSQLLSLLHKYPEQRLPLLRTPSTFQRGIPLDRPTGSHGGKPVEEQPTGREQPRAGVRPLALLWPAGGAAAAAVWRLLLPGPERGLLRRAAAGRRVRRTVPGPGVPAPRRCPGAAGREAAAAGPPVLADCRRLPLGGSGTPAIIGPR